MPRILERHDLRGLATFAGLRASLDDPTFKNSIVGQNWAQVVVTSERHEQYRYSPDAGWTRVDADQFLISIQDPSDGVFS
jgi:hypothetical protein